MAQLVLPLLIGFFYVAMKDSTHTYNALLRWLTAAVLMFAISATLPLDAQAQKRRAKTTKSTTSTVVRTGPDRKLCGEVLDSETGEVLPFSNVFIQGTLIGTLTDLDGHFDISVPARYDTVRFSAMGYRDNWMLVDDAVKTLKSRDTLRVKMKPDNIAIDEIKVRPDDGPERIMKSLIANKKRNNPQSHQRAEYEKYTRWEYALSNISDKAKGNFIFKDAQKLMQVSSVDSTRYLPVYFSETLSKNELQMEPRKARTTVLADRTLGIDVFKQYEIGGFSNALDNEINFYDDLVKLMGVGFVSPIANDGLLYYDYFIVDSAMISAPAGLGSYVGLRSDTIPDGATRVYTLKFRPHNTGDRALIGTMDIETRRYSPLRIDAEMPQWTNINFVKQLKLKSTYQMVGDTVPFYGTNQMEMHVDYMPVNSTKKRMEIRCNMYNSQTDVKLDMTDTLELSMRALAVETLKADNYKEQSDEFWDERRHGEMTEEQQRANAMIDSLNNVGTIKAFNHLAKAAITGFVDVGRVEIGPVGEMFNTNKIEGLHLGVGIRTSKEVSEQWVLSGIVGYGFKNTRPTFGAGVGYRFKTPMRRTIELNYSNRIMKIGEDENILYLYENMLSTSETNIVAQLFKREEIDELLYCQKVRLRYDNEWFTGMQTRLQATWLRQESPKYYPFTQGGEEVDHVDQFEASLDFRFTWLEKFMDDGLQRMYLSTDWPVVHVTVAGGHTKAGSKERNYARLHTTLKQDFYFGQTKLNLAVENGIYFGRLPYSCLNIARGNKTYGFYRYDFNMMNYLEFVCDKYLYVHADYHLEGMLLHKLPAIYKLGLREVVGAKLMIGDLSNRHAHLLDLPEGVSGPTKPYVELNVGIDNVLRFFRFDVVWRATSESLVGAPRVGFRAQFALKL